MNTISSFNDILYFVFHTEWNSNDVLTGMDLYSNLYLNITNFTHTKT